jgi:hypothetical protein
MVGLREQPPANKKGNVCDIQLKAGMGSYAGNGTTPASTLASSLDAWAEGRGIDGWVPNDVSQWEPTPCAVLGNIG